MKLLTMSNAKIAKSQTDEYLVAILHLKPSTTVCPNATKGCLAACLNTAGRGRFDKTQTARQKKTDWLLRDRDSFMRQLAYDIVALERKAARENKQAVVRLNGTSDIAWEQQAVSTIISDGNGTIIHKNLMVMFPNVRFYDYTKSYDRMFDSLHNQHWPCNYHLCFSRSESNDVECKIVLQHGGQVAIVADDYWDVASWDSHAMEMVNKIHKGDETDLRFLQPPGIVHLTPKGRAKDDTTGFVLRAAA